MGKRPYEGKNRAEIRDEIMRKDIELTQEDIPFGWPPSLCDLINKLLKKNPSERLGINGVK